MEQENINQGQFRQAVKTELARMLEKSSGRNQNRGRYEPEGLTAKNEEEKQIIKEIVFSHCAEEKRQKSGVFRQGVIIGNNVMFVPNFDELKREYEKRIQQPFAEEVEVKSFFKTNILDRFLRGNNAISQMYGLLSEGSEIVPIGAHFQVYYRHFCTCYKVEELLKFEEFLLNNSRPRIKQNKGIRHPPYDPNFWNKETFELFKYLYENYYWQEKRPKQRLGNIWQYLTSLSGNGYSFSAKKADYKNFILIHYGVEITNTDKRPSYEEEKRKMEDWRKNLD